MSRRYVDFSVGIESASGGGYRVRAASPQAEAESLTRFEFDLGRLHEALRCRANAPPRRDLFPPAGGPSADLDLVAVGRALFAALFAGAVGELYSAVWSAAQAAGEGLRIRLHLRPQEPELAGLTGIPWEILFDERAGCFPCLNPLNPLVRHLDLPRPVAGAGRGAGRGGDAARDLRSRGAHVQQGFVRQARRRGAYRSRRWRGPSRPLPRRLGKQGLGGTGAVPARIGCAERGGDHERKISGA